MAKFDAKIQAVFSHCAKIQSLAAQIEQEIAKIQQLLAGQKFQVRPRRLKRYKFYIDDWLQNFGARLAVFRALKAGEPADEPVPGLRCYKAVQSKKAPKIEPKRDTLNF